MELKGWISLLFKVHGSSLYQEEGKAKNRWLSTGVQLRLGYNLNVKKGSYRFGLKLADW